MFGRGQDEDPHFRRTVLEKLDQILSLLTKVEEETMAAFDDLQAQVTATVGAEQSAIVLLQGIAAKLANVVTAAEAQDLGAQLKTSADALAAAVAATPA